MDQFSSIEYDRAFQRFDPEYQRFLSASAFSNILLLTAKGQIVYSAQQGKRLGKNFSQSTVNQTLVNTLFQTVKMRIASGSQQKQIHYDRTGYPFTNDWIVLSDFFPENNTSEKIAYLSYPIMQHQRFNGMIIFTLPLSSLLGITNKKTGLADKSRAYLSVKNVPLSFSHSLSSGSTSDIIKPIKNQSESLMYPIFFTLGKRYRIDNAVNNQGEDLLMTIDEIEFVSKHWALVVEMSAVEMLLRKKQFSWLAIVIILVSIPLLGLITYFLSVHLSGPLYALLRVTKGLSKGNFDVVMADIAHHNESYSIAGRFIAMQQIISKQTKQLDALNLALKGKKSAVYFDITTKLKQNSTYSLTQACFSQSFNKRASLAQALKQSKNVHFTHLLIKQCGYNQEARLLEVLSKTHRDQSQKELLKILHNKEINRLAYRLLVVICMQDALKIWQKASGLTKVDLAESSGIWSVYLDRSSPQTRTLDKYLLEPTLPKKPRWREVLKTGNYVNCFIGRMDDHAQRKEIMKFPLFLRLRYNLSQLTPPLC